MSRSTIEPEKKYKIAEMLEEGKSKRLIAKSLGISEGAVQHWGLVLGVASRRRQFRRSGHVIRGASVVRYFSDEEDALLMALRIQNYGFSAISRVFARRWPDRPRTPATLKYRVLTIERQKMQLAETA